MRMFSIWGRVLWGLALWSLTICAIISAVLLQAQQQPPAPVAQRGKLLSKLRDFAERAAAQQAANQNNTAPPLLPDPRLISPTFQANAAAPTSAVQATLIS